MSWEKVLTVNSGKVWFAKEPGGTGTLDGILECGEHMLVRFQVPEFKPDFPIAEEGEEVVGGSAALRTRSRTRPQDAPPDEVLRFCSRLLAPSQEQTGSGYVFAPDLLLHGNRQVKCSLNDQEHAPDKRYLVEFAHLQDPYVLIRHGEERPLVTPEWLAGAVSGRLEREYGWRPLESHWVLGA
jgi:hypothetical protein